MEMGPKLNPVTVCTLYTHNFRKTPPDCFNHPSLYTSHSLTSFFVTMFSFTVNLLADGKCNFAYWFGKTEKVRARDWTHNRQFEACAQFETGEQVKPLGHYCVCRLLIIENNGNYFNIDCRYVKAKASEWVSLESNLVENNCFRKLCSGRT